MPVESNISDRCFHIGGEGGGDSYCDSSHSSSNDYSSSCDSKDGGDSSGGDGNKGNNSKIFYSVYTYGLINEVFCILNCIALNGNDQ